MPLREEPNFLYLLAGILSLLLLGPIAEFVPGLGRSSVLLIGYNSLLLLGIWSLHTRRGVFLTGVILATLNVVLSVLSTYSASIYIDGLTLLVLFLFQLLSLQVAAGPVFSTTRVSINRLLGAVCIYLLLGMSWGIAYIVVAWLNPEAMSGLAVSDNTVYWNAMYFSFVTLTTLGYGDILPTTAFAQALTYLEAVVGQIYLAMLIGSLVGAYISQQNKQNPDAQK